MHKKIVNISAVSAVVLLVGAFLVGMFFLRDTYLYFCAQIDNSQYTVTHKSRKVLYEYKLNSYADNGKLRNILIQTTCELRGDEFLKLKYTYPGGVVDREEVEWEAHPEKLQSIYPKRR